MCHIHSLKRTQFHLVNEANQVLADPELRQIFDENGAKAVLFFLEVVEGMSDHQRHIGRVIVICPCLCRI